MDVRKMKKDDLELMSNKDITFNLLENSKKTINTADLFNEILKYDYLSLGKISTVPN